ncbi:MAG: hypothetical protein WDM78_21405 [Puia sp.]
MFSLFFGLRWQLLVEAFSFLTGLKGSTWMFLYSVIALALNEIIGTWLSDEVTNDNLGSWLFWIGRWFGAVGVVYALHAICGLFKQKKGWYYYALHYAIILVILSFPFLYYTSANLATLVLFLFSLEYSRRGWLAYRRGYPGAVVLFLAQIIFFISLIVRILLSVRGDVTLAQLIAFLGVVNIPINWSIYMAGEYARTGLLLQVRIKEIENLSQRAIVQEQEKQQILADQNETLEMKVSERTSQLNESLRNASVYASPAYPIGENGIPR